jgi:hypothetical protein
VVYGRKPFEGELRKVKRALEVEGELEVRERTELKKIKEENEDTVLPEAIGVQGEMDVKREKDIKMESEMQ